MLESVLSKNKFQMPFVVLWLIPVWIFISGPLFCAGQPDVIASGLQHKNKMDHTNKPFQPSVTVSPGEFDWIQLTSGEWLNGELKLLYNETLEFDSTKLDLHYLKWKDVAYFHGLRMFSVRLEGSQGQFTVQGFVEVTSDNVIIYTGEEKKYYSRSKLVAMVPGEPREIHYWSGKISLGLNLSGGNTEQFQWTSISNIRRQTTKTRFTADWVGNFQETDGDETVNNQRLSARFDLSKNQKYYFTPLYGEYYKDPFANIDKRVTVGAGLGYSIIKSGRIEWEVACGPGYQETRFESVESGDDSKVSTPAVLAGTEFNAELTKNIDFDLSYNFQFVNQKSGSYNHHFITQLAFELTSLLDFDIAFIWDRIQDPQTNTEGITPNQDDYYLVIGVGIDF